MGGVTRPYGTWPSPLTADLVARALDQPQDVRVHRSAVYWLERRPREGGRTVLVSVNADGQKRDVLPGVDVRSTVHEYGGGAYALAGEVVFYVEGGSGLIYRADPGRPPRPITVEGPVRYGDLFWDASREELLAVREEHLGPRSVRHAIVRIDPHGDRHGTVLAEGHAFYAAPRVQPGGRLLAFLTWDPPNMPWDGTELWLAERLPEGGISYAWRLAGGPEESISQPLWSPDGTLFFLSDRTGFWNFYAWRGGDVVAVLSLPREFGFPDWQLGQHTYAYTRTGHILSAFVDDGFVRLARIDPIRATFEPLPLPTVEVQSVAAEGDVAAMVVASERRPLHVVRYVEGRGAETLADYGQELVQPGWLALPEAVLFPGEGGHQAQAFFFPPVHPDVEGPEAERPPLLIFCHGGPTAMATAAWNPIVQFWCTRGFAVALVNYTGSSGFGRAVRQRLYGRWGEADVADVRALARFLAMEGRVDPHRVALRGGSAGGYTVLAAMASCQDFVGATSLYGISDLLQLERTTHVFEAHYVARLVGAEPAEESRYQARSPYYQAEAIQKPILFLQGLEDHVVPPEQSEQLAQALARRGIPSFYVPFAGEGHGFRRQETIRQVLVLEEAFYGYVMALPNPGSDLRDRLYRYRVPSAEEHIR